MTGVSFGVYASSLHKQFLLKQLSLLRVLHPDSKLIVIKKLTLHGIKEQTEILLRRGHKPILMVAGEMSSTEENTDYYVSAV
ncbi:hypothetical protein AGMMS49573_07470 [Endomicrobiia bacterium]|nr:hypothetical protein AGMMS49523_08170 [Endomicrobiia bacterium]GHT12594.1 hypothetical protein AGMMS49571_04840 [Endomicrobiia bacterium]GHT16824.1 hypothetical protein AGMMS49573_07470 [Endomicrobiia bacterium]GHT20687.1 hypothetical protein AGMMS49929_08020 [Endomicrobiia bacterium]GHT27246.1 hypothetical protein AGMMS49995_05800 [Endomicrobiia bacterium]